MLLFDRAETLKDLLPLRDLFADHKLGIHSGTIHLQRPVGPKIFDQIAKVHFLKLLANLCQLPATCQPLGERLDRFILHLRILSEQKNG